MEMCSFNLHFVLHYLLLIGRQAHSEYMYLRSVKFDLSFLYLYIQLVVNFIFDILILIIGLLNFIFSFCCPIKCRYLSVYVVWVRIAILIQYVLKLLRPLPISLVLMINLIFKHLPGVTS